ncbi:unnamed protein product [Clavelina lepadiformis]|uniref:Uncharacterized protein n=1 Tax=Clavelina lepadiformis TaxID=159417 RepID=A0ABP0G7F1_CLALP
MLLRNQFLSENATRNALDVADQTRPENQGMLESFHFWFPVSLTIAGFLAFILYMVVVRFIQMRESARTRDYTVLPAVDDPLEHKKRPESSSRISSSKRSSSHVPISVVH